MKRVNVGDVALNASSASSDVKAFSNKRCDENDTELRSTANCIDQLASRRAAFCLFVCSFRMFAEAITSTGVGG